MLFVRNLHFVRFFVFRPILLLLVRCFRSVFLSHNFVFRQTHLICLRWFGSICRLSNLKCANFYYGLLNLRDIYWRSCLAPPSYLTSGKLNWSGLIFFIIYFLYFTSSTCKKIGDHYHKTSLFYRWNAELKMIPIYTNCYDQFFLP